MPQQITKDTTQYLQNKSFDEKAQILAILPVEYDGNIDQQSGLRKKQSELIAMKITVDGTDTYVGKAPIGTAQATAGWQVFKVAVSGGTTTITWKDGNASFDNTATDLTAGSFS